MVSLNDCPKQATDSVGRVIESQHSGGMEAVIVIPSTRKVEVLNELGARIWSLLDGNRTVEQIVDLICGEYEVDSEIVEKDTLEFLDILYKRGIVEIEMDSELD